TSPAPCSSRRRPATAPRRSARRSSSSSRPPRVPSPSPTSPGSRSRTPGTPSPTRASATPPPRSTPTASRRAAGSAPSPARTRRSTAAPRSRSWSPPGRSRPPPRSRASPPRPRPRSQSRNPPHRRRPRSRRTTRRAMSPATARTTRARERPDEGAAMGTADGTARTAGSAARILVVDNYDSFVFTIVGYLRQMGAETVVVRNDEVPTTAEDAVDLTGIDGVLSSPGPGNPTTAGRSLEVIGACAADELPMLGVCLGHQALGQYFGATVDHAPQLMHGRTSELTHEG